MEAPASAAKTERLFGLLFRQVRFQSRQVFQPFVSDIAKSKFFSSFVLKAGAVQVGIQPGPEVLVQVESQDAHSSENFMSESTLDPQTYHGDAHVDSSVRGRWEDREEPVDERKSKDGDYNV